MNSIDIVPFASLEEALKEKKISMRTYERVKIAKSYIEKKYKMKRVEEEEKRKDWDFIMNKIEELKVSQEEAEKIKKDILHKEGEYLRMKRQKIQIRDFESIAIIGKGAFGEVRVCKYTPTGEIVAVKKMKKEEMHKKNQVLHVREEQMVLSEAKNPWIVDLKFSFQDEHFLYLVMEFLPGGDLMSLLMNKDILSEDESRFYAAELVLAIESVHKLNCIHRDLKPDNVLIDKDGHIKLSDFGLSKKVGINLYNNERINGNGIHNGGNLNGNMDTLSYGRSIKDLASMSKNRKRRIYAFSTVGTPDYIAPEVFSQKGYGPEVDWWSLGVILFEMLIGYPPFFSDSATDTCKKILNWKTSLVIPPENKLSNDAIDLIKRLITDVDKRLGYNGADEIKKHPFFKKIDWKTINSITPEFVPKIENDFDSKYFDQFDEEELFYPEEENRNMNQNSSGNTKKPNKDMCFVNFTYKREMDNYKSSIVSALEVLDSLKESMKQTDNTQREEENGANFRNNSEVKNSLVINSNLFTHSNDANGDISSLDNIKSPKSLQITQTLKMDSVLQKVEKQEKPQNYMNTAESFQPESNRTKKVKNLSPQPNSNSNHKTKSNGLKEDQIPSVTQINFNSKAISSPKQTLLTINGNEGGNNINLKQQTLIKSNLSKDFIKQVSLKIKKPIQGQGGINNPTEHNFFTKKAGSNNPGGVNGVLPNANAHEKIGGSDCLLKSNNDLEKKLKINKSKLGFINTNPKSPVGSKENSKKLTQQNNTNTNIPYIQTHESLTTQNQNCNQSKKLFSNNIKSNVNYSNNQPNALITANYLKDFASSENINSSKGFNSSIKVRQQVKLSTTKETPSNNLIINKLLGSDGIQPFSTKNSAGKKITFNPANININTATYNTNSSTEALAQLNFNSNQNKFLKITDPVLSQRSTDKVKKHLK